MPEIPADLRYSEDHLWVRARPGTSLARAGVTDFAQQSLGDVVEVTPPGPGETITAGEACGDIESTKSVSDLIAPVTGTVRARNDDLIERGVSVSAIRHKSPIDGWKGDWRPGTDRSAVTTPASPTSPTQTAAPGCSRRSASSPSTRRSGQAAMSAMPASVRRQRRELTR
jgi:glycine cleavage system H protein